MFGSSKTIPSTVEKTYIRVLNKFRLILYSIFSLIRNLFILHIKIMNFFVKLKVQNSGQMRKSLNIEK